jgi:hypothetical protein
MTNTMNILGTSLARAAAVALGGMIENGARYTGKLDADRPGTTTAQVAYLDRSVAAADRAIARVLGVSL